MNLKSLKKIRKVLFEIPEYKNWREIIVSLAKGQMPTRVILKNGIQIDAPEDNTILSTVRRVFFRKVYNPSNLHIETNDTVVDIGANIGVFTLFTASRTQNTVYAFEPFPGNYEFLERNIRANGLHNVSTHAVAVCDKVGTERLFVSEISEGHLLFDHNAKGKLEEYVEVPTTTLQHIIEDNNLERIDFLKLDCEGSEGNILQSTPINYLKRVRKIAIEFHDYVSLLKHDEMEKLLIKAGFTTKLKWNGKKPSGYLYGFRN